MLLKFLIHSFKAITLTEVTNQLHSFPSRVVSCALERLLSKVGWFNHLFFRHPWFPEDSIFGNKVINAANLSGFNWYSGLWLNSGPPTQVGTIKCPLDWLIRLSLVSHNKNYLPLIGRRLPLSRDQWISFGLQFQSGKSHLIRGARQPGHVTGTDFVSRPVVGSDFPCVCNSPNANRLGQSFQLFGHNRTSLSYDSLYRIKQSWIFSMCMYPNLTLCIFDELFSTDSSCELRNVLEDSYMHSWVVSWRDQCNLGGCRTDVCVVIQRTGQQTANELVKKAEDFSGN